MPHLKELYRTHRDQGLVLIGVHTTSDGGKMADFVRDQEIDYPVAIDVADQTTGAFRVDSYPDYYLVDRSGRLRVADLANQELDRAVEALLAERPGGEGSHSARLAAEAAARARLLASLPERWPAGAYRAVRGGRDVGRILLRNESVRTGEVPGIRFRDRVSFRLEDDEGHADLDQVWLAGPDFLLDHLSLEMEGPDGKRAIQARQVKGALTGSVDGRPVALELPENAITELGLFRLVTCLPFRKGAEHEFVLLQGFDLSLEGGHRLRCLGPEEVEIGGERLASWKYEHAPGSQERSTYWVGEDRVLLRMRFEHGEGVEEMILESRESVPR